MRVRASREIKLRGADEASSLVAVQKSIFQKLQGPPGAAGDSAGAFGPETVWQAPDTEWNLEDLTFARPKRVQPAFDVFESACEGDEC